MAHNLKKGMKVRITEAYVYDNIGFMLTRPYPSEGMVIDDDPHHPAIDIGGRLCTIVDGWGLTPIEDKA